MMESVELVIFDMDGLMFDTEMMYLKFAPGTAKELGYDITVQGWGGFAVPKDTPDDVVENQS